MDRIKINLDIVNISQFHNMGIELWIDENKFFDNKISPGRHHVVHEFECSEGEHWFRIFFKDKVLENTKIDDDGNIISDALIGIENICLDDINIDTILHSLADYVHDVNGTQVMAVHPFYGHLGCNGQVQVKFSSPIYLWLLENM